VSRWPIVLSLLLAVLAPVSAAGGDYTGPIIDAHAHLPNARAIDRYVAAMKRHNVSKVVLLGVGGLQEEDAEWIAAAAEAYPDEVVPAQPVPDPLRGDAAGTLDVELARTKARVMGEAQLRHLRRGIDRNPNDPAFLEILRLGAMRGVPVVVHYDLARAAPALERALALQRDAVLVLAHAGGGKPAEIETLLARHPNLMIDLSGMHFQRTPALASERGRLDARWKALIERRPERFLMGLDVWAESLFAPRMLDRLFGWMRRVLGELRPEAAERVAWRNAATLYRLD
jgi:predicted TIM-barrel fold metal-dependent hydrolase